MTLDGPVITEEVLESPEGDELTPFPPPRHALDDSVTSMSTLEVSFKVT